MPLHRLRLVALFLLLSSAAPAQESFETAPVRPEGGQYVPAPFMPVARDAQGVQCGNRRYAMTGAVPLASVGPRQLLREASFLLDGQPLAPPAIRWVVSTPAVATAERSWEQGGVGLRLRETVEYDGFITSDLTIEPRSRPARVRDLTLKLVFQPDASLLYHVPSTSKTPAGFWPTQAQFDDPIPGIWGGDDRAGFACYVATFRNWHTAGPLVRLEHEPSGPGTITFPIIAQPTDVAAPLSYRFGFIATPVRAPEPKHWQLFSLPPGADELQPFVGRNLFWGQMSDHYATFSTNAPQGDAAKAEAVAEVHRRGKKALAYTTYAHVADGAVATPDAWLVLGVKGKRISSPVSPSTEERRVFCCPGSRDWVEWKIKDLGHAVERYQVDGFYVDTSYVIMSCANPAHGHGWTGPDGQLRADFPVWSMREVWRQAYELLCRTHGRAEIYAHHKAGCPPALAAFTTAFCDGEQYTSQSIRNLTLDAFRAQIAGRNIGPLALFLSEYYRSERFQMRERSQHHNPVESVMLPLVHDVLPTGYPGNHPVRELLMLRQDLDLADAAWTPYYASDNPWRAEGAPAVVVSAYRNRRGDSVLVAGNPGFEDARFRLVGPEASTRGRTFVAIDVLSRVGRHSAATPGYRWEKADPGEPITVRARQLALFAWVERPDSLAAFARQQGLVSAREAHQRRTPVRAGATLLDDFEDPDWTLGNDDGRILTTLRDPVDTRRAMRLEAAPRHNAAALLHTFERLQDLSACTGISFWVRPDRDLPARAIEVKLRNAARWTPSAVLVSPQPKDVLRAGQWTELRYEFRNAPRTDVDILRIYYNRGDLYNGPIDFDEMLLLGDPPRDAARAAKPSAPTKRVPAGVLDRPDRPQ